MNTKSKIQKVTTRGQITLPKSWRDVHKTNIIKVNLKEDSIIITPFKEEVDEVVWSAIRDNKGKSIEAQEFIKILDNLIAEK